MHVVRWRGSTLQVRLVAAEVFDRLHGVVGSAVIDEVIPDQVTPGDRDGDAMSTRSMAAPSHGCEGTLVRSYVGSAGSP